MGITMPSFQMYNIETPHGFESARSMLHVYELSLLYGVCRNDYQGRGEIVDGGPLLGVGTFAMARGLAHHGAVANKHKRIYLFDLWLASGLGDYTADVGAATGDRV